MHTIFPSVTFPKPLNHASSSVLIQQNLLEVVEVGRCLRKEKALGRIPFLAPATTTTTTTTRKTTARSYNMQHTKSKPKLNIFSTAIQMVPTRVR